MSQEYKDTSPAAVLTAVGEPPTAKAVSQAEKPREWTAEQKDAIDTRDRTLLVSAAAGSGKTAVLTERIIASLIDEENPVDITRMLIVTFTRAAAAEMRMRIGKAIGKKLSQISATLNLLPDRQSEAAKALARTHKRLTRQLMLLGSAKISTIDSFYLDLVRANFEAAGLSPSFRLADESELLSVRREIMNRVIDRVYREEPDFIAVAELLSDVRSEQSLSEKLLKLTESLEKLPERYDFLLTAAAENEGIADAPFDNPYGKIVFENLAKYAADCVEMTDRTLALVDADPEASSLHACRGASLFQMRELALGILAAIEAKDLARLQAALVLPDRLAGAKKIEDVPCLEETRDALDLCYAFRDEFKKYILKLKPFTAEEIRGGGAEAATILRLVHKALSLYGKEYAAAKSERDVAEFGDISRAAYRLLVGADGNKTPLAAALSASFDAVYIDEYQDVDPMQDATFAAISTEKNRFMVGDIKQSIYRFRGAEPALFASYKRDFPPFKKGDAQTAATIFMSKCFRCDENVIRFANCVSGYLFARSAESIGYTDEDNLFFKKDLPYEGYTSPRCQVMVYDEGDGSKKGKDAEEEGDTTVIDDAEARMIAAEIRRLIDEEHLANGAPITAGDIAVLARSAAFAAPLARHLAALGIAANDTSRENFFENPEVLCMYALLAVIDNPLRDIYLASTLRSPFFGFTLEELIAVRQSADSSLSLYEALGEAALTLTDGALRARVSAFLETLSRYREKAAELPVDRLLRYLYRDTAVLAFATEKADTEQKNRRQNLLRLYEYARTFEAGGFKGLYRFVRYVEDLMQNKTEMPTPEGPKDAVKLVTIHHAKGLEYPVCFVATTGKLFNTSDLRRHILIEPSLGAAASVPNTGAFSRANTFGREALKLRMEQLMREEEMRVLYVAMTRARERLYITGKPRYSLANTEKHVKKALSPVTSHYALAGNSYLEWILTALAACEHKDFCQITYHTPDTLSVLLAKASTPKKEEKSAKEAAELAATAAVYEKRFDFSYPHAHLHALPAKLSVSKLSPEVLDVYDTEPSETLNKADRERLLHTFERAPRFLAEKTTPDAAARGTATHEFLQFCHLEGAASDVKKELDRLIGSGFLSPDAAEAVRLDELKAFFASDFFDALQGARRVWREKRFNIFLPASEFTKKEERAAAVSEELLLVQGVIDLVFEDAEGHLLLCDYKTDRLTAAELANPALAAKALFARHGQQLSYYKRAVRALFGKAPDRTVIYSLHLGATLDEPTD